ncbi:MAG: hypothetical protein Q4C96_07785 [Planctomycetia bacterium]|nr:hypothetical protein [Planctomycetia bacterium]
MNIHRTYKTKEIQNFAQFFHLQQDKKKRERYHPLRMETLELREMLSATPLGTSTPIPDTSEYMNPISLPSAVPFHEDAESAARLTQQTPDTEFSENPPARISVSMLEKNARMVDQLLMNLDERAFHDRAQTPNFSERLLSERPASASFKENLTINIQKEAATDFVLLHDLAADVPEGASSALQAFMEVSFSGDENVIQTSEISDSSTTLSDEKSLTDRQGISLDAESETKTTETKTLTSARNSGINNFSSTYDDYSMYNPPSIFPRTLFGMNPLTLNFPGSGGIFTYPNIPGLAGPVQGWNGGGPLRLIPGFSGTGNYYYLNVYGSVARTVWLYATFFTNQHTVQPGKFDPENAIRNSAWENYGPFGTKLGSEVSFFMDPQQAKQQQELQHQRENEMRQQLDKTQKMKEKEQRYSTEKIILEEIPFLEEADELEMDDQIPFIEWEHIPR